ncbi:MAG: BtrH N-terminal domain-containing protein [Candidatus Omnitrophota bacterium]
MKKIIKNFKPLSGKHCNSSSIHQVFHHFGHKISEEMIFGLASGLSFVYFEFGFSPTPFIGGRIKLFEFEHNLTESLGAKIETKKTSNIKKAYAELVKLILDDTPVMVYVDMAELSYLGLPEGYHFGGHSIVVFGIDEENKTAYISDRDKKGYKITLNDKENPFDYHIIPLEELEKARSSKFKPFPPENKWVVFDFKNIKEVDQGMLKKAIQKTVHCMINPPIKNLGLKGVKMLSQEVIRKWKKFDLEKLKLSALNSFIMINKVGGTGGGIFRKMYGDFLIESSEIMKNERIKETGRDLRKIGNDWDRAADKFFDIYKKGAVDLLDEIAKDVEEIYFKETQIFKDLGGQVL